MFITPNKTLDTRSNGSFRVWSWVFDAPGEGEHVELPISLAASVQVIGDGNVAIEAGIDRRNFVRVLAFNGPSLEPLNVASRYVRATCLSGSATVRLLLVSER